VTPTCAFFPRHVHEPSKAGKASSIANLKEFRVSRFSIRYDINDDGDINLTELSYCLKALGFQTSIKQILEKYDKNHDGSFDHNEFQEIVHDLNEATRGQNQQNHRFEQLRNSTKKMHGLNVSTIDLSNAGKR
jgi:hypothetical protein